MNDALVGIVERFLKKGSKVYIEGQLETRKWTDKDGQEKYSTEVVLRPYRGELTMLDGANNNRAGGGAPAFGGSDETPAFGPSAGSGSSADLDDSIPF